MKQYFAFSCGDGYGWAYHYSGDGQRDYARSTIATGYSELGDKLAEDLRKLIHYNSGGGIVTLLNGLTETFPIPIEVNILQEEQFQSIRTALAEYVIPAEERQTLTKQQPK
ncbi:hypothetical protein J4401_03760 [Candidatus Woesearchaeota archaeon]|nr:hypothetical protein [Candidatus Woesearchaeota archaeon]